MRASAEVIYQATFLREGLRGHADFLLRVDRPSDLGEHSYDVADTKLARRAKPYFTVQLCFYSELLAAVQGVEPESIHVILGDGEQHSFRLTEFSAYFRHIRDAFLAALSDGLPDTYPEPPPHCQLCRWRTHCDERRLADDHLSLVANINRRQRELLVESGIGTLAALGSADRLAVGGIAPDVLERLRSQAALQLAARRSGEHSYLLREPEQGRGFARLPKPAPGDVFFDMEGDPFFDNEGLEYLFGLVTAEDGEPLFTAIWGRDRAEERAALEQFIDLVGERRRRFPDLHVYHYASYEVTALKRLAGAHGTREEELDQLLRDEVFVDLYKVVRESMLISQPNYSIKRLEAFYMEQRDTAVSDGGDSIIMFEQWLEQGEKAILDEIAAYNRDDCLSTLKLRDWLLERREEAVLRFEESEEQARRLAWFEPEPRERSEEVEEFLVENRAVWERLMEGIPDDAADRDDEQRARALMAHLLEYHRREGRPVYWAMFARMEAEPGDLVDDPDCVDRLSPDGSTPARHVKKSVVERLRFPPQETKPRTRSKVLDPRDGKNPGTVVALDADAGWLDLKRGTTLGKRPLPEALIPPGPIEARQQRAALRRLAEALTAGEDERYPAALRILPRDPPAPHGSEVGEAALYLDGGYLFVQGPPGAGKTYSGARAIVDLLEAGMRVGVTATAHKVIHNMLTEVEDVAAERGFAFRGLKKNSSDNPESEFDSAHGLIESVGDNGALSDPEVALTAGTAWHYCREDTAPLDYLFIDEAGQVSLADALALATARNVVLLGDPQQLPQVSQGAHPEESSLSVLEHLLGECQTVDPAHGIFLGETWRLHPRIAAFVSELMYDGRLGSAPGRERQRIEAGGELSGAGLRWLPVEHQGRSQSSPEEAEAIAAAIEPLLAGATYTDAEGAAHPLRSEDILVLTPYNAQVPYLQDHLPDGVRIGTVDKFQGQEAQVAFFSMATSSGDQILRNVEFLFSRNRLNVAISRARCLAVLACSPRLLDIHAKSIEQMRLVKCLV